MAYLLRFAAPRFTSHHRRAAGVLATFAVLHPRSQALTPPLLLRRDAPAQAFALRGWDTARTYQDQSRNRDASVLWARASQTSEDAAAARDTGHSFNAATEAVTASGTEQQVPLVPGTLFRLRAGDHAVCVEHVAGWSDVATIQGRTTGGRTWRAIAAPTGAGCGGADVATAGGSPGVRQTYEIFAGGEMSPDSGSPRLGSRGEEAGLLRLAVPEKWISLDVCTTGRAVSVSKVVEADLRVATAGAPVTLGSVRGLEVYLCTATPEVAVAAAAHSSIDDISRIGGGSITGGEVSGTAVTIIAGGSIDIRRIVGGVLVLEVTSGVAAAGSTLSTGDPSGSACTAARQGPAMVASAGMSQGAACCRPAITLGAAYVGKLQIRTGGGDVRVGTLDCGPHVGGGGGVAAPAPEPAAGSASDTAGGGGGESGAAEGGARILSFGGAVTVDSLEGDALVDSGGGTIKVLVQGGVRTCRLLSGGGAIDLALSSSTALDELEIRGAGQLLVDPGLEPHLDQLAANSGTQLPAAAVGCSAGHVLRVAVAEEPLSRRGGGRRLDPGSRRGRLLVEAGGGTVSVRRLGWMDALRARMAERRAQHA